MTLVPNRRRLLSGSSAFVALLALALGLSCGTAGKLPQDAGSTTTDKDVPRVYNPATGDYEAVNNPLVLVDTVAWSEDVTSEPITTSEIVRAGLKDRYKVAFLLPMSAAKNQSFTDNIAPKTRRFLNYYAGIKLALERLSNQGIVIDAEVLDTEESPKVVGDQLKEMRDVDVIVGPYQRDALREAAEFAARYKIPVVSPWTPSITLDYPNAHFVQMVPGLRTHASSAMEFIGQRISDPKLYIVGRNEREKARFENYHTAHRQYNPSLEPIEELMIGDGSIDLNTTNLDTLLPQNRTTVFILPYYSRNDEDFVGSFLRKLHAEKLERDVIVFGLPQWANFRKLNPDYLESMQVHITMAQHIDSNAPDVKDFTERYYAKFGSIPEPSAMQGFDMVRYLGEALSKFGVQFIEQSTETVSDHGGIYLRPVYEEDARPDGNFPVLYYENRGISVLQFLDQAYQVIN